MKTNQFFIMGVLWVAGCSSNHAPAPVKEVDRSIKYYHYEAGSWSDTTYRVRAGDTLYSIAFRANKDFKEIAEFNQLSPPYRLTPDQELTLIKPVESGVQLGRVEDITLTKNNNRNIGGQINVEPPPNKAYGDTATNKGGTKTAHEPQHVAKPVESAVENKQTVSRKPIMPETRYRQISSWTWPSSGQVTRRFSAGEPYYAGLEFSSERGTPVLAAAQGKVVYVGSALKGYGNLIIIKHNDDYISAYGHNEKVFVKEQDWVVKGQRISTMGSSGRQDVRLRFELRYRGKSVNPENYLPRSR